MIPPRRLIALALFLLMVQTARAQWPQPRLQSIFPAGGQIGQSVEIELGGTDLDVAERLWFDHPGLSAEHLEGNRFRVAIHEDIPIGQYDLRVVGRFGISNPRTFVIEVHPETSEVEPNDAPEQATTIAINSVVNGRSNQTPDVDYFAFEGRAGQRVLIDLAGVRIESRIDGWLRLFDPTGREIAVSQDEATLDPFLDVTLPIDGLYRLCVQDLVYAGSAEHGYRLTVHDGPHLDSVLPSVVAPGEEVTLTLHGRNIGGVLVADCLAGGHPLERVEVPFRAPRREDLNSGAGSDYLAGPAATRMGVEYRYRTDRGESNPIFIAVAEDPVVVEIEPNNNPVTAQVVPIPCVVSGTFGAAGDLDRYQFEAKRGQVYWIEVRAESLGSPADPNLIVQQVAENGQVKDLASMDDVPDPRGFPVSTTTVDPLLRWQAPADGTYLVAVSDLYGTQRGDVRFRYTLQIRPQRPDFTLLVVPIGVAAQPLGLSLRAGSRTLATALVKRRDGFQGPVRVEAVASPPGVTVTPTVIAEGQFQAPIVIEAALNAGGVVGTIELVGQPVLSEPTDPEAGPDGQGAEPARPVIPITDVWTGNTDRNNPYTLSRVTRGLAVSVIPETPPLRLDVTPDLAEVTRGSQVEFSVHVDRVEGFEAPVEIVATDLPQDVPEAKVTVDKDNMSATLTLTVPDKVAPGVYTILLRGTAPYSFKRNPGDEKETQVNLVEPSNAITLIIRE